VLSIDPVLEADPDAIIRGAGPATHRRMESTDRQQPTGKAIPERPGATECGSYITGQLLYIDGGYMASI